MMDDRLIVAAAEPWWLAHTEHSLKSRHEVNELMSLISVNILKGSGVIIPIFWENMEKIFVNHVCNRG